MSQFPPAPGSAAPDEAAHPSERPREHRRSPLAARIAVLLERHRACRRAGAEAESAAEPDDADLNRVHLTGWLGSEPLLYRVGDHPVAALALAVERRWRVPSGALQVETSWFNLTAWEGLAERCGRLLRRGDRVYIEGALHLWTELSGPASHACHTITLERIVLLAARSASADPTAHLRGAPPFGVDPAHADMR